MGFNTSKKITQELKNEIAEKAGKLISGELKQKSIPHADAAGYPIMLSDHLSGEEFTKFNVYGSADGVGTLDSESGKYKIPIVQRCKNLFDLSKVPSAENKTNNSFRVVLKTDNAKYYVNKYTVPDANALLGQTLTLKADFTASGENKGNIMVAWTSGTTIKATAAMISVSGTAKIFTLPETIPEGADTLQIYFYGNTSVDNVPKGEYIEYSNVQLEIGSSATEYEAYREKAVTAFLDSALGDDEYIDLINEKLHSADAVTDITVTGDLTPLDGDSITFMCGGDVSPSKMEVTYYQDINKVIDELKNAILSQGGNV